MVARHLIPLVLTTVPLSTPEDKKISYWELFYYFLTEVLGGLILGSAR